MFAYDTNLFCSHKNIKTLFQIVNSELELVTEWFLANNLSLNAKKAKYVLFHKVTMCDSLPLQLPFLKILEFFTGLVIYLTSKTFKKSIFPPLTFTSVILILLGLVLLKLNSRES